MRSRLLIGALLLVAIGGCSRSDDASGGGPGGGAGGAGGGARGPGGRRGPQGPPEVGFIVVKTQTVPIVTELAGRTAAFEMSEVRPQISGIIKARLFTEGSVVHAGQTLYQIDSRLYQAAAAQARANLQNAQATQSAAQALADRYKPLAAIEAVSKQDYTNATASARQAAASVAQNRALVQTATINLGFTRITAPITGRIGRSLFTTGALVTTAQADPLATIQRLDPIFVDIQQSSTALLALRKSMAAQGESAAASAAVKLVLEDGSEYPQTGKLEFAEAVVDPTTGTVTLRARFPNPNGLLLPGMYVRARVTQSTAQNAILIPEQGVTRDPKGNATVMLVGPDKKAVSRPVTTSATVGAAWLVTSGLKPGDRVITEGLNQLKAGTLVRPVPAGSKPRAGRKGGQGGGDGAAGGTAGRSAPGA